MKKYVIIVGMISLAKLVSAQMTMAEYEKNQQKIIETQPKISIDNNSNSIAVQKTAKKSSNDFVILTYRNIPNKSKSVDLRIGNRKYFGISKGNKAGIWRLISLNDEIAVFSSLRGKKTIKFRKVTFPKSQSIPIKQSFNGVVPSIKNSIKN